jgi:hypothetical protein
MRRAAVILSTVAVATTLVPSAVAQGGLVIMEVCGVSSCKRINTGLELIHADGPAPTRVAPPQPGPYFKLEASNAGPPPAFFVPSAGVVRARPDTHGFESPAWLKLAAATEAAVRDVLDGLEPFPAPRITQVRIDGREVGDAHKYLAIYAAFPRAAEGTTLSGNASFIALESDAPSPWTDGLNRIWYEPADNLLSRDGEIVRPSSAVVALIEHPKEPESSELPWGTIAAVAAPVALFGLILAVWLLTGARRPRPA